MSTSPYAVVVCTDTHMAPAAACVLHWVQQKNSVNVDLYLVGVGFDDKTRAALANFSKKRNAPIRLLEHHQESYSGHELQRFGLAALTRLSLDTILPTGYQRVLYLDSDIYVAGDLSPLFEISLDGHALGASFDISKKGPSFTSERRETLGLAPNADYFTSAILLFDWQRALAVNLFAKARAAFTQGKNFKFPDQDAINIAADGNYRKLPQQWHVEPHLWRLVPDFRILHFSGRYKPWDDSAPVMLAKYKSAFSAALAGTNWSAFCSPKTPITPKNILRSARYFLKMRKKERSIKHYYGADLRILKKK